MNFTNLPYAFYEQTKKFNALNNIWNLYVPLIHGKVSTVGLKTNPYCINNSEWERKSPELLPTVSWRDVMIFMVSTPSPYTSEAVKVEESPSL